MKLKLKIKLFTTIRLKAGLRIIEIEIDQALTVLEVLQTVSDIIDFDLLEELTDNYELKSDINILINDKNIRELSILNTIIDKDSIISIYPVAAES